VQKTTKPIERGHRGFRTIGILLRFFTFFTVFYVFLKISKSRDFLRFFVVLRTFSRTMTVSNSDYWTTKSSTASRCHNNVSSVTSLIGSQSTTWPRYRWRQASGRLWRHWLWPTTEVSSTWRHYVISWRHSASQSAILLVLRSHTTPVSFHVHFIMFLITNKRKNRSCDIGFGLVSVKRNTILTYPQFAEWGPFG